MRTIINKFIITFFLVFNVVTLNAQFIEINKNINKMEVLSASDTELTINVTIGNYEKKPIEINGNTYYSITNNEGTPMLQKGFPDLPKITKSINIPHFLGVNASVIGTEYEEYNIQVVPSKGVLMRTIDPNSIPYEFGKVYNEDDFFPEIRFDLGEPYLLRTERGMALNVYPFAYNPVQQILRVYTSITINISFNGSNPKNSLSNQSELGNKFFDAIYKNHFINFTKKRAVYGTEKMLIICSDLFVNQMQPFVTHKNGIGLTTEMFALSNVGSTPTAIRQFIQNRYNEDNQLTFVLLVGDFDQIPTFFSGGGGSDPTYSLLEGDDNYPDIIVGRFSAEDINQVETMVNRTISYETASNQQMTAWFKRGTGIASNDANVGHNNERDWQHIRKIRDILLNWRYTNVSELYDGSQGGTDAAGNPSIAMVANEINNGVSLINYTGHGLVDRWSTSSFTNANVNSLTNTNQWPFIFSVACFNGNFTNDICFAETWLRATHNQQPTGAIGFYGSSISQPWNPPMEAQDKFNELLVNEDFTTFGELCFIGSCAMLDKYGSSNGSSGTNTFLTWNYFGDPSVSYVDHFKTDLLVRDDPQDDGTEPNPRPIYWQSPDIKLVDYSFNPIPNSQLHNYTSCYIGVTIRNIGNVASKGNEKLHVHWSKSSVNSVWKSSWVHPSPWALIFGYPRGEEITNSQGLNIPVLQPNEEITLYVLWNLPSYIHQYNEVINPYFRALKFRLNWGFALMARIGDGNYIPNLNTSRIPTTIFARNSNNIAVDNGSLLLFKKDFSNLILLEASTLQHSTISFKQLLKEGEYKLNDFAEVYALLSNDLIDKLDFNKSSGIKRVDENRVFLTSDNSELVFKPLNSEEEVYFIGAEVNFISDKMPELNDFNFDLTFKQEGEEDEIMRYTAIRDADVYFKAQAEASKKKVVKAKEEVTLTSNIIYEDATYTWYNEAEEVIGEEYQITIIPEYSQKYKIEIKQEKDGFKAYDEVEVIVVDGVIKLISPNPAQDYIRVDYLLSDNAENASIQISNFQNTVSVSYPILTTENYTDISLPNFVSGYYIVKLIIDGAVVDGQTLIIK